MNYKGTAHKVGEHIDTDAIIPARFLVTSDAKELGANCMAGLEPDWVKRVKPGDIMVAGRNFGCGSSREHAAVTLKAVKAGAVVAESFARIFFRNATNLGLPLVVCRGVSSRVKKGDRLTLDLARSVLKNEATGEELPCEPITDYALKILESGGIKPLLRAQYARD